MPAIPLFFFSRWQTYAWANYGPRYAPNNFSVLTAQNITQTTAQIAVIPGPGGQWRAAIGERSGEYNMLTPWVQATPGIGSVALIQGLKPSTTYYYNAVLDGYLPNPVGLPLSGCYYTDEQSFTTASPPQPPQITSTSADNSAGAGEVDFAIGTNIASTGYIEWGLDTTYGTQSPFTSGTGLPGNLLRVSIIGTPTTTYHYRAVVTANGLTTTGPDHTVTTLA